MRKTCQPASALRRFRPAPPLLGRFSINLVKKVFDFTRPPAPPLIESDPSSWDYET